MERSCEKAFQDRREAGRALSKVLAMYAGREDVVVLGLPRGGVPVAAQVAEGLNAPLDVWTVRKLGMPGHPEFAMGAIASGGVVQLDETLIREFGIGKQQVEQVVQRERAELGRRERVYRRGRPTLELQGKTVIVVDDGLATGWTMTAAVESLRKLSPKWILVAVPVASPRAQREMSVTADGCVTIFTPETFRAVGEWYLDFRPTTDEEVIACMARFGNGSRRQGSKPA